MASGAGKAAQPATGPGSAVNGTAAEFPNNIEQELYDYQMHGKMCKKIAQLTKGGGGRCGPSRRERDRRVSATETLSAVRHHHDTDTVSTSLQLLLQQCRLFSPVSAAARRVHLPLPGRR